VKNFERRLKILGLILFLASFLSPAKTLAFEVGLGFGPFLPSRIGGVREVMNGWAFRGGLETSKGFFEAEVFTAHGGGADYATGALDFRLDLDSDEEPSPLPVHFNLGFHIDNYRPATQDGVKFSGGWHYGGGFRVPLGPITSPLALRADFKHRFSPGSSLIVMIGFSYSTDSSGGSGGSEAP